MIRIARAVTALVAAVVVLLGGGGWYFSGQIESDGLRVKPDVLEKNLVVDAASPTSITLHEKGSRVRELHTSGVYGVQWATGFGEVSGTAGAGHDVTKSFRLLTGTLPAAGAAAAITSDAFPDDPAVALGVAVREVTYTSAAGSFPAWYVPGRGTTWVVLVHGKGANRTQMLRMMRVPVREGLPALDIAYRGDASLPEDPTGRYQYGRTEWHDLDAAVSWAQQHGAQHVVLVGASMGGAIVAAFLEHSSRAASVSGLLLDSPALSFDDEVDLGASERDLPLIGVPIPGVLTWTAKRLATIRYDVNWHALDYLDDVSWVRVPVLDVHGTADRTVPVSDSARLATRQAGRVTFLRLAGVGHVQGWNSNPSAYETAEAMFLGRVSSLS
jgi:alpha-beta hydrolase superfamily lysophospholipase